MKRRFRILAAFLAIVMLFAALPVMPAFAAAADLEDGANYMIVSKKNGKALTVADNSAEEGAGIVQMPAQGYASQVWTLKQTEDQCWQLINASSGKYMSIPGGSTERDVKAVQTAEAGDNCKWIVNDTDDGYCWIAPKPAPTLCLNISQNSDNDGQAIIQWPWEDSDNEKWSFVKVDQAQANPMLSPDAVTAADAWLANFFYEEDGKGYFENCAGNQFWQCVESIEVVIDAYERTGDLKYLDAAEKLYAGFVSGNKTGAKGTDWSGNDFNDDIMWAVIASTRLYMMTNNSYYLEVGKSNFDMCYARAWDTTFMGGGLWWRTENESKNACVEGPGAIAACLLGDATGDTGYYDKAKAIIDWTIEELYQEDGGLWDSVYTNRDPNKWISSYNQGTFIGACTMLSKHFDDVDYLSYAKKAAERATRLNLNGEQNSGDLIGFKGILARWLGYYCRESGDDSFVGFMQQWAQTIWNNRNSDNLMWTKFDSKTPDDLKNQRIDGVNARDWGYWGCSPAVSWVVNTPGTVDAAHILKGIAADEAVTVSADETATIAVTMDPADTLAKGLVWSVTDNSIARIDSHTENGAVIRGVKEGATTLTVSSVQDADVQTAIRVTVTPSKYVRVELEAENGVLSDGATISDNGNASGGKHVGNLGEGEDDSVTFTVNSPADVTATLNLYYATEQDRWFGVVVNGGEEQTVEGLSTGGWTTVGREPVSVEIQLKAGDNTIVVGGNNVDPAPNLDWIEIVYLPPSCSHELVHFEAVEAGCHSMGNVEYWQCSVCDLCWTDEACTKEIKYEDVNLPAKGGEVIHFEAVEPGCHSNGSIEYWFCPDCEGFWADEALTQVTNSKNVNLPATGDGNVIHFEAVAPTEEEDGYIEHWYCENCELFWQDEALTQLTNSKNVILPALPTNPTDPTDPGACEHEIVHIEAVEPGCHSLGNIEHWYCKVCEIFWQDEALTQLTNSKNVIQPATGSKNVVHFEAVEPGCHSLGNVEYWFCPDCEGFWTDEACTQVTNSKSVNLPAKGGEVVHVEAVAPTEEENGNIEHWYCEECELFWQDEALTQLTNSKNVILPALNCLAKDYTDVNLEGWYHPAIDFVLGEEMMQGVGNGLFAPDAKLTRAQLVQILYNYEGKPDHSGENKFGDVAENAWFYDAITWAAENGIVKGITETEYAPDDEITREQMVTIIWRYVGEPGATGNEYTSEDAAEIFSFPDAGEMSGYAVDAIAWALDNGVVKGMDDGSFAPKATSTRAQMAQVLMNYFG